MAQERARKPRERAPLRVVRGPPMTPIVDLADGVRMYAALQEQARHLEEILNDLRGRILRSMENAEVEQLDVDGIQAIRQIRHFAPQLDVEKVTRLLDQEGRLREAQRLVLDAETAREVIEQLYVQGRVGRGELPFTEPREVQALIIRENPEHRSEE